MCKNSGKFQFSLSDAEKEVEKWEIIEKKEGIMP